MKHIITEGMREYMNHEAADQALPMRLLILAEQSRTTAFGGTLHLFGGALVPIDPLLGVDKSQIMRRVSFVTGGHFIDNMLARGGYAGRREQLHHDVFDSLHDPALVDIDSDRFDIREHAGPMRQKGEEIFRIGLRAIRLCGIDELAMCLETTAASPETESCFRVGMGWVLNYLIEHDKRIALEEVASTDWDSELKALTPDIE